MHVKSISFLDNSKNVIKSCKITSLPFAEVSIISKSIEFFNDPEPCFIHRSAVMKRMIIEMDDYFYSISKQGINEIMWSTFPERFRQVIETVGVVGSIIFML